MCTRKDYETSGRELQVMMHLGRSLMSSWAAAVARVLSPQTKRLFDVHEFCRVTGAARVFICIKITLDGQRGEESHSIRPKSPQDFSPFRNAAVSH